MGRNFDDYPGCQPFRSWANTYAQDCNKSRYYEIWRLLKEKPKISPDLLNPTLQVQVCNFFLQI